MDEWRIIALLALAARGLLGVFNGRLLYLGDFTAFDPVTTSVFIKMQGFGLLSDHLGSNKPRITGRGMDMLTRALTAAQIAALEDIAVAPNRR